MTKKLLLSIAMIVFAAVSSRAADPTGKWFGKFDDGADVGLVLKTEGKKLTGTIYTPEGDGPISNGKFTATTVTFTFATGGINVPYTGTLSGDKLDLTVTKKDKASKATLSKIPNDQPFHMTGAMRASMTEFWTPVPKVIDPGPYTTMSAPPSDAIVLFDGKDLSKWKSRDNSEAKWKVENGGFTVVKGTGDITTKQKFGDYQLHIEWKIPEDIQGQSQARGNSGLFLQDMSDDLGIEGYWYEVQVLDSYNSPTYVNGQAGSIYKQSAPLVNAMRKPGEWNVYDITYTAPRFKEDGSLYAPARVTVIHNGVVVQNNYAIRGHTAYIGHPAYFKPHGKAPISLQDHGDPSKAISFRNIWIREM